MPLRKVKPGDPLKIPAETFNAMIDAAEAHRNDRSLGEAQSIDSGTDRITVLGYNNGDTAVQPYQPVMAAWAGTPTTLWGLWDNAEAFRETPAIGVYLQSDLTSYDEGYTPWGVGYGERMTLCVALDGIAPGEFGRVLLRGTCMITLDTGSPTWLSREKICAGPNNSDKWIQVPSSPVRILTQDRRDPGTGRALVEVGKHEVRRWQFKVAHVSGSTDADPLPAEIEIWPQDPDYYMVTAYPIDPETGDAYATWTSGKHIRVCKRNPWTWPNVFGGDLLDVEYAVFEGEASVGTWQVVDPPVDAQLGTLRLWDWPMSSEPLELSGISDIPRGWALCDGSQSTFTIRVNSTSYTVNCPDLRERFIRGPGLSLSTGGHESTVHEHGIPYTTVDVRGPESGYTPETIRQVADLTDPATLDNLPPYMDYQIIMRVQ